MKKPRKQSKTKAPRKASSSGSWSRDALAEARKTEVKENGK